MTTTSLNQLLRMGAAKRTNLLEKLAISRGKTLHALDSVPHDLPKIFQQETRKLKFGCVVNLLKVIRSSFVDSKACMEKLQDAGVGKALLDSLRAMKTDTRNRYLERFLSYLADLFEWESFGKNERGHLLEEILSIVQSRYSDCDLLLTEALGLFMTMLTTDSQFILDSMKASKICCPLMLQIVYNMPKTKSFHFQALLVEIVYRILRLLRKSTQKKDQELMQKLLESLPQVLSAGIQHVTPKEFRAGTRSLLNQFNESVGVVKTFPMKKLQFESNGGNKIVTANDVEWFDLGGLIYEIEASFKVSNEIVEGVVKMHCSDIEEYVPEAKFIKMRIKRAITLADIAPNVHDSEWGDFRDITVVIFMDPSVLSKVAAVLRARFESTTNSESKVTNFGQYDAGNNATQTADQDHGSFYELLAESKKKKKDSVLRKSQNGKEKERQQSKSGKEVMVESQMFFKSKQKVNKREIKKELLENTKTQERPLHKLSRKRTETVQTSNQLIDHIKVEKQERLEMEHYSTAPNFSRENKRMKLTNSINAANQKPSLDTGGESKRHYLNADTRMNSRVTVKQEPSEHIDNTRYERSSREIKNAQIRVVSPESSINLCQKKTPPREEKTSRHSKRKQPVYLDSCESMHNFDSGKFANVMAEKPDKLANDHEKRTQLISRTDNQCAEVLTKLRQYPKTSENGIQTVLESFELFTSEAERKTRSSNNDEEVDCSSQSSDSSMSLIGPSSPSQQHLSPKRQPHLIPGSPRQKLLSNVSCIEQMPETRSDVLGRESQSELVERMKVLVDIILEQQSKFRQSTTHQLVHQTEEKFQKSWSGYLCSLSERLGLSNIESMVHNALIMHRDQVHSVGTLQEEVVLNLNSSGTLEEDLLSECVNYMHAEATSIRHKWTSQLKGIEKKIDSTRSKRKLQLQNKLKEIRNKFNSNDLIEIQALLGRI
ncbi:hypothetical protein AeRB84_004195 [Aphanomyces euteiches]|nr:hypothetical protein AeRB84_004195 [Aphanomyces euteiches]